VIRMVAGDGPAAPHGEILEHCARRLEALDSERLEYAILALHTAQAD